MGLKQTIAGKIALVFAEAIEEKTDIRAEACKLDVLLDKHLGKSSEKLQRGVLTDLVFEFLMGMYDEDLSDLAQRLENKAGVIRSSKGEI